MSRQSACSAKIKVAIAAVLVLAAGAARASGERPPSEKECRAWAASLQAAVGVQSVDRFNELIDWDTLLAAATALPVDSPEIESSRAKFIQGFQSAVLSEKTGFAQSVLATQKAGGSYRFLRTVAVDGRKRARFRMVSPSGGLNYHDFILGRSRNGELLAVDLYIFLIGEPYSQNTRRMFLSFAEKALKEKLDQLAPADRDFMTHLGEFAALAQYAREKQNREVLELYRVLPPSLKKQKTVLLLRLTAAQSVSRGEYLSAVDDFRREYPNDALVDIVSIDGFIRRKSYVRALESLDRVDKAVRGDPYLNVLRANLRARQGNYDAARQLARQAIAEEPTMKNAYYFLVDLSLKTKDFAETARLLETLKTRFGVGFDSLENSAPFAEFVKSPEYKTWRRTHPLEN
jgi:tetratricopeptide (TPR) repeat protein